MSAVKNPTKPFVVIHDSAHGETARGGEALRRAVVAIGNFDGVHRGHRAVIGAAAERARARGVPAAVVTFEPHPRALFHPGAPLFRLTPETAKLRLFAGCGLDGAIVLRFDAALAQLTAEEFVSDILVDRYAISGAAIGFNFHFGKGRHGSPDFLKTQGDKLGFAVDIVAPLQDAGRPVSSGPIRAALAAGDVATAASLLGYPWFVTGDVLHGDKRGRELGYPTANIALDPSCAFKQGIYAVRVGVNGARHDGVASFGRRPTFDNGPPLLEVHLFDFANDLYGTRIDVAFIAWIRGEEKFASGEDLIAHMHADSRSARAALANAKDAFPPFGPHLTAT